jgi:hypothetical protein
VIALQESIIEYDGPVFIEPLNCLAAKAAGCSERDSSIPVFIHEWECDYLA